MRRTQARRNEVANPLPPLDRQTEAALRDSIRRYGVIVPVVQDQHGRTLDGHHRERLAAELEVVCPVEVLEVRDDDHARELARDLNLVRRHLTPEQRQRIVSSLRAEGHSTRAIAGALGVSQRTVVKDVAGELSLGTHLPDRVTGLDGKTYPSRGRRRRTRLLREERPLFVRFAEAVLGGIDVLEAPDIVAAIPGKERPRWAGVLRELEVKAGAGALKLRTDETVDDVDVLDRDEAVILSRIHEVLRTEGEIRDEPLMAQLWPLVEPGEAYRRGTREALRHPERRIELGARAIVRDVIRRAEGRLELEITRKPKGGWRSIKAHGIPNKGGT